MKIGVISDTHGRLPTKVHELFSDCDYIIHAGDIGTQELVDELETIAPLIAVLGNCDCQNLSARKGPIQNWECLEIAGLRFFVIHKPDDMNAAICGRGALQPALSPRPQVCVHGHTHKPSCKEPQRPFEPWIICPGSPTQPRGRNKPSVAKITIEANGISVEIISV